jgi:hypothetical protein
VVKFIKLSRLRWAGYVMRLNDNDPAEKVRMSQPGGSRPRGRPKLRWKTRWQKMQQQLDVESGKVLLATVRTGGNLKEGKAHPGL